MSNLRFSPEEERAIKLFAEMHTSVGRRIHSWIAEVIPAIGLLAYGLWAGKHLYIIVAFLPLVFFATLRIYRQHKYSQILKSIFTKVHAHQSDKIGAQQVAGGDATR